MTVPGVPRAVDGEGRDLSRFAVVDAWVFDLDNTLYPRHTNLFAQVDRIWTLTRQHRDAILRECPEAAPRVELLSRDGGDIPDPIGGGMDEYVDCANAIEKHVRMLVAQILPAPP